MCEPVYPLWQGHNSADFHLVFQQAEQSGAYKSKDKVHYHSDGKGFKVSIISSGYAFCCVEKFYNSNNGKNAGILDIDDQVVCQSEA